MPGAGAIHPINGDHALTLPGGCRRRLGGFPITRRLRRPQISTNYATRPTVRWRVRVEGQPNKKVRIPVGPGERGFENAYFAARAGEDVPKPAVHAEPKKGTLDDLCRRFLEWMEGEVAAGSLSPLTLSSRRTGLTQACDVRDPDGDRLGSLDADLPKEAFTHILGAFRGRKAAAHTCLKALRAAYRWGQARGYPKSGAVFRVKSGYRQGDGATPWTADDFTRFLDRHPPGSTARLWFALAYATGGRIGDAPHLGPANIQTHDEERFLEWQPSKKGSAMVSVPIHAMLAEELENHRTRPTFLIADHGRRSPPLHRSATVYVSGSFRRAWSMLTARRPAPSTESGRAWRR